jgi:Pentapeptide repeats (8 copies)
LTSDGKPNIEVRLGAIYALERIAFDSPRDHWTIMEVLTAYVRQNAPAPATDPTEGENESAITKGPSKETQAILTVLGRRRLGKNREMEGQRLDLGKIDLRGANLTYAHLRNAFLDGACLSGASFKGAIVEVGAFIRVNAEGASFFDAHLEGAKFVAAHAEGALFKRAHLERASFMGAHLKEADFTEAYLEEVDFRGARGLTVEQVQRAISWKRAKFSPSFFPAPDSQPSQESNLSET